MNYQKIINFWFQEIENSKWFIKDEEFDELIISRFQNIHAKAIKCELYEWRKTAQGRLAEIIILDQFSRNMFRELPSAFAYDSLALALAQEAVSQNLDNQLTQIEKSFLYLPYMHSESLEIHEVAIKLYKENGLELNLQYEMKHKEIIEKFGRYPHRNEILGRESTKEEIEFLKLPNSSF